MVDITLTPEEIESLRAIVIRLDALMEDSPNRQLANESNALEDILKRVEG